jgi:Yersinia/Haemophilus virulence surface antigen
MRELVKLHGGKMLKSFDQTKYVKKKKFPKHLSEGVCAALSTVWVSRRAKGEDFFKYLDSNQARAQVAMLQHREVGASELDKASSAVRSKIQEELDELRDSKDLKPKDKNDLRRDLLNQQARLFGSDAFLRDLKRSQYRVDYINEQAGLDGKIDKGLEIPKAVKNVSVSGEGFVIFGMNGKDSGHAMGLYRNRDGVRFFDPNYGEAFFEDRADFQGFLSEFVDPCSRDVLNGTMEDITITDFASSRMPTSPEDAELADHRYLALNLTFPEMIGLATSYYQNPTTTQNVVSGGGSSA